MHCVVPENIHTPPPTPLEIPFYCHTFVYKIGLLKPPSPLEFPLTLLGVGMDIFWNYMYTLEVLKIWNFQNKDAMTFWQSAKGSVSNRSTAKQKQW